MLLCGLPPPSECIKGQCVSWMSFSAAGRRTFSNGYSMTRGGGSCGGEEDMVIDKELGMIFVE